MSRYLLAAMVVVSACSDRESRVATCARMTCPAPSHAVYVSAKYFHGCLCAPAEEVQR